MNHRKRVLIVDDERSITRLIRLNLEQTGAYQVLEENSASHALTAAREFEPDVILLDVLMPALDGGNLASRIQQSPGLGRVPIVFLTAAVTKDEVESHHGMIGGLPFLAKPVDTAELLQCLAQQLPVA